MVNGALDYFSFAATLPEARGVFIDTSDLIRLWEGPRRVFLVVRRPRGQSVVAALPPAHVHECRRSSESADYVVLDIICVTLSAGLC